MEVVPCGVKRVPGLEVMTVSCFVAAFDMCNVEKWQRRAHFGRHILTEVGNLRMYVRQER